MNKESGKEEVNLGYSRHEFIKASALTVGAAGVLSVYGQVPAQAADKPKGLPLSMAGYKFDRTKALIDGRVKIEGCDIQFQESGIGDINTNLFSGPQTFEVTESRLRHHQNDTFQSSGWCLDRWDWPLQQASSCIISDIPIRTRKLQPQPENPVAKRSHQP